MIPWHKKFWTQIGRRQNWHKIMEWYVGVDIRIDRPHYSGYKRLIEFEIAMPRWAWRPYCWIKGDHHTREVALKDQDTACYWCGLSLKHLVPEKYEKRNNT